MIVLRSPGGEAEPAGECALAVGNFDGLHRGHRRLLDRLFREAGRGRLPARVLTFTPHPEKIFGPDRVFMLQTLDQRLEGLEQLGLAEVIVVRFTRAFAAMSARRFAERVLARKLGAKVVVVGENFRFGRGGRGTPEALTGLGEELGFRTVSVPPLSLGGEVVSSSLIRGLLAQGEVERACRLLGRPYEIVGDVVRGAGRGRGLGFPTANIQTPNEIVPQGVYVTRIFVGGRGLPSMTNVGVRPTFDRAGSSIETHVLGFEDDLACSSVRLAFLRRLRDERAFPGPEALAAQLRRDAEAARRYFGATRRRPDRA
jgi:riboflavin kinase/FMN adenylyltransferase